MKFSSKNYHACTHLKIGLVIHCEVSLQKIPSKFCKISPELVENCSSKTSFLFSKKFNILQDHIFFWWGFLFVHLGF